jgi:hypothetical protein
MNVVVIPVFNRPELLALTLEYIVKADGAPDLYFVFVEDHPQNPLNQQLIAKFPYFYSNIFLPERKSEGNAAAIFAGLHAAKALTTRMDVEVVFVVEEDVLVSRGFFAAHEAIHKRFRPFAVSSVYNHNRKKEQLPADPNALYADFNFQAVGTSIDPRFLDIILDHLCPEYFNDKQGYCEREFPKSKIPFVEYDGLVGRVMNSLNEKCMYPFVPRAAHVGYYGMIRQGVPPEGETFEERLACLRGMTEADMNERTDTKDIRLIDFDAVYDLENFRIEEVGIYSGY